MERWQLEIAEQRIESLPNYKFSPPFRTFLQTKVWKCPKGSFERNILGPNLIILLLQ